MLLCSTAAARSETPDFDRDIQPILVEHCLDCHGGMKQAGGLLLVGREGFFSETETGEIPIVPGDPEASYLLQVVTEPDDDFRMPTVEHGRRLNAEEIDTLTSWIEAGAEWGSPWLFRRPVRSPLPEVALSDWPRVSLDHFVLKRLAEANQKPSPESSRSAWLRRVSFDLVGLPPSEKERDEFLTDESSEAYERVVDRLTASPHFGERWTSVWLDLARYADTMGYERDPTRDIWPYRDWLTRAFDSDMPYDDFLLKQLAGDLLPQATLDDRLATAFHRNTSTNVEGGTDDEEFRVAAVIDRVNTTWQALQGVTMGCAQCHDHPYDPITQRDYYRFYACLNATQDGDLAEELPKLAVPNDPLQFAEANRLDREELATRKRLHALVTTLADDTLWHGLAFDGAKSTGETELELRPVTESINGSAMDGVEVLAAGTVSDESLYTLRSPAEPGHLTALRIDALPKQIASALRSPEMGFVLARLRLFVERAEGKEEEVFFRTAFCDEANPFFAATESLSDGSRGWSVYSRMWRPRWAVFVLDKAFDGSAIVLREGDRLRIELKHDKELDGQEAIVLRRLRIATSSNGRWSELMTGAEFTQLEAKITELEQSRREIPSTAMPVMVERSLAMTRPTYLFARGNWLTPSEQVTPDLPAIFDAEDFDKAEPARLQMARWIASTENPLTARVWVNRVWAELLGQGIIETLGEFGTSGTEASHPALLDHLAIRFQDDMSWQLKPLLREIVLSATYRQSARQTPELAATDPTNRLLGHGPRNRLRAEMIRDQALVLSGRFNAERYGPPVMPYQPTVSQPNVNSSFTWQTATDDSRFRRALYTYWKRTAGYPSLMTFDTPSRQQCTARRSITNTPLQALATLNDPVYVELAEGFATRILDRKAESLADRIAWAYREATGTGPTPASLAALVDLYDEAWSQNEKKDLFAMTVVAGTIMNLDATLTK